VKMVVRKGGLAVQICLLVNKMYTSTKYTTTNIVKPPTQCPPIRLVSMQPNYQVPFSKPGQTQSFLSSCSK